MNKIYRLLLLTFLLGSCSDLSNTSSTSPSSSEPPFPIPTVSSPTVLNEKEIAFGLYPNSLVIDSELVAKIESSNLQKGNLIIVDEQYYYKHENKKQYESKYGVTISSGTHYYKVEPIVWQILAKNNNQYLLMSKEVIDSHRFSESYLGDRSGIYSSNYEKSEIRNWLNSEFKNFAFGDSNVLKQVEVDNSLASTMKESNPYVCNNTQDFVFLPSVHDLTNSAYGFEDYGNGYVGDENRVTTRTDFASSRQEFDSTIDETPIAGSAPYWTRTPYEKSLVVPDKGDYSGATIYSCLKNGGLSAPSASDDDAFYYSLGGVRPCICITYDFGEFPCHVQLPEPIVSYEAGTVAIDELASIIRKAVDIEKKYMSSVYMSNGSTNDTDTIRIDRYNDGYYRYSVASAGYNAYAYSTNDFSHNYNCYSTDGGETFSDIGDSHPDDTDDTYSAVFGYGQIGISPAAFVACQSGLIYESFDFVPYDIFCKKIVESYLLRFKFPQIGNSLYFSVELDINRYGGIDFMKMGTGTTPEVEVVPGSDYMTKFLNRVDAPQFMVDLFSDYHE